MMAAKGALLWLVVVMVIELDGATMTAAPPMECQDYKLLTNKHRDWHGAAPLVHSDVNLSPGWYRFSHKPFDRLKEGHQNNFNRSTPAVCGSTYPGVILESHPTKDQGLVRMHVCFKYFKCYTSFSCHGCAYTRPIFVRNCGTFFVYFLPGVVSGVNMTYCTEEGQAQSGSLQNSSVANNTAMECLLSQPLSIGGRGWNTPSWVACDLQMDSWYRLDLGHQIVQDCPRVSPLSAANERLCGATFRGWLNGTHPMPSQGQVERQVCFSRSTDCYCQFRTTVKITNCQTHFAYMLPTPPLCSARYCTQQTNGTGPQAVTDGQRGFRSAHELCSVATPLADDTRQWSYMGTNAMECDASLNGVYRFLDSVGATLQMRAGCSETQLFRRIGRCNTMLAGYLFDSHPTVNEGVVDRVVCFANSNELLMPTCRCEINHLIQVQNCGAYFAYRIQGVPRCTARYCTESSPGAAVTPTDELKKQDSTTNEAGTPAWKVDVTLWLLVVAAVVVVASLVLVIVSLRLLCLIRTALDDKTTYTATYDKPVFNLFKDNDKMELHETELKPQQMLNKKGNVYLHATAAGQMSRPYDDVKNSLPPVHGDSQLINPHYMGLRWQPQGLEQDDHSSI